MNALINSQAEITARPERISGLSHIRRVTLSGNVSAQLALSEHTLSEASRLRYAAYHAQGYIDHDPSGLFLDEFDRRPSSRTIVTYRNGTPAASARLCLYDPAGTIPGSESTPGFAVFGQEINELMEDVAGTADSMRAMEVMRLVRHPDFERDHEVLFALLMAIGYVILHFGAEIVFSGVRRNHIPFYRRFGFVQITEPRPYPKLKFQTALIAFVKGAGSEHLPDIRIFEEVSKDDPQYHQLMAGNATSIERPHAPQRGASVTAMADVGS